jgi:hypothetical protein
MSCEARFAGLFREWLRRLLNRCPKPGQIAARIVNPNPKHARRTHIWENPNAFRRHAQWFEIPAGGPRGIDKLRGLIRTDVPKEPDGKMKLLAASPARRTFGKGATQLLLSSPDGVLYAFGNRQCDKQTKLFG